MMTWHAVPKSMHDWFHSIIVRPVRFPCTPSLHPPSGFVAHVFHPGSPGFQESPEHSKFSIEKFGFPFPVRPTARPADASRIKSLGSLSSYGLYI